MTYESVDPCSRASAIRLATAHLKWLSAVTIANPTALTLTLKKSYRGRTIDLYDAQTAFRHVMRRINVAVHGNAHRRYGRCVKVIPSLEVMDDRRLHYHAVLERPERIDFESYYKLIVVSLERVDCFHREHKILSVRDSGWLAYVTKPSSKAVLDQIIDLGNLQIR